MLLFSVGVNWLFSYEVLIIILLMLVVVRCLRCYIISGLLLVISSGFGVCRVSGCICLFLLV